MACASSSPSVAPLPPPPTSPGTHAAGVDAPELQDILARHWEWTLIQFPEFASRLGDHRFDHRLTDVRWQAELDRNAVRRGFLEAARRIDEASLSPRDRTTRRLFIRNLEDEIEAEVCRFPLWSLSPRSNPITELNYMPLGQPKDTPEQMANLRARYLAYVNRIEHTVSNLSLGVRAGWFANRESTERVLTMVRKQLEQPVDEWPMLVDARPSDAFPEDAVESTMTSLRTVLEDEIRPALMRYRRFVEERILPFARAGKAKVGMSGLPFGRECYQSRIEHFTTLNTTPEEIHQTGMQEIRRINDEMRDIGERLFETRELSKIFERLRNDPKVHFNEEEEILNKAEQALARAKAAIPDYFGRLPKAECVVTEIPEYEAPFTTVAYYRQPVPDGSKPGQYYVNTHAPTTRTRYEAEALAYHEAIPGHHLQIAIAQELSDVPAFRKHLGMTVFVEGWALYAEHLAEEMGLYSGDLDRMGKLSYEAWRASRLVVDTGIHAMGWSRQRAKDFMKRHTALAANNIDNEVDRYIVWPGQAVAYKTGQLEILRLRRAAEERLGDRFKLPAFHDAVLLGGAVSLPVLRQRVEAYMSADVGAS